MSQVPQTWTVGSILNWTTAYFQKQGIESARLDAEVLISHALQFERIGLYVQFTMPVAEPERDLIRALVKKRATERVPVAYLVGYKEFFGIKFEVNSHVLVPRPETESIVEAGRAFLAAEDGFKKEEARVLDIGTGSGAIAIAMALQNPGIQVVATDISPEALKIARKNAKTHGLSDRIEFIHSDVFDSLDATQPFHLIVSNPPYIDPAERDDLMPDVRDHEPEEALFAGKKGLEILEAIVTKAPQFMHDGALLVLEFAPPSRVPELAALVASHSGYGPVAEVKDVAGTAWGVQARAGSKEVPKHLSLMSD
jgi:release factor glutamine methyltransferase